MDKRWILIIIILFVGISTLYFATIQSDSVGNAVTPIQNVMVTVPADYDVGNETDTSLELLGEENDERAVIELVREKDKAFDLMKADLKDLKNSDNASNIENDTEDFAGITTYTIKYQEIKEDNTVNHTVVYVNKLNKSFIIDTSGYTDTNKQINDLTYIIDTIMLDFKVSDY